MDPLPVNDANKFNTFIFDLPLRGLTTVNELRSKMLAGILHVTILTIVCLLVFLGMLPVLFATGFCERVTHFRDILFAGGSSSSISKDLLLMLSTT